MPYEMSWLVEKRIVYTRMYGYVTSEEITAQNEEMKAFVTKSENLLHLVNNGSDMTGSNMGLKDLQKTQFTDIPNLGWAIYVNPNKIERFFASVITQITNKRGRQFATLEEGLRFLQEVDETLPPIPVPDHLQLSA